jgi:HSP20 family protein
MATTFADPFDVLFNLQRALEGRLESDWLHDQTGSQGPFPPINVFQQGGDILAIVELPGIEKDSLTVQAKDNTIGSPERSRASSIVHCQFRFNSTPIA